MKQELEKSHEANAMIVNIFSYVTSYDDNLSEIIVNL